MQPIPSVVAILVCDRIIVEEGTAKKSVIGIFTRVNAPRLPFAWPLGFYAKMTDGEGEYKFRVAVVCANDNRPVAGLDLTPVNISDRLHSVELALNLPPVPFERAGRYEFQLYGNDVFLGHVTLDVRTASPEGT
jgi:hypothetical protein